MDRKRKKLPLIFQAESSECGLASLAMIAGFHGFQISISDLRSRFPVSLEGLSLRSLLHIAGQIGFRAQPLRCDVNELVSVKLPAMLHWDLEHMVVLKKASHKRFILHDPARGEMRVNASELSQHFTGIVVELDPVADFVNTTKSKKLTLPNLLGALGHLKLTFGQILALSAALELLVLTQPIFMRTLVDTGIGNGDRLFIWKTASILALAAALLGITSLLRDSAVLRAGTSLNFSIMRRIFHHALRLPLVFFEKRPIGQLIERYRVTDEIERFLISGLPLALIDGVMTLLSIGMVFYLSTTLGIVSLITVSVYYLGKELGYGNVRSWQRRLMWAKGEENGHLIETLRTIPTTKINGIEDVRYQAWVHHYSNLIQAQRRVGLADNVYRGSKYLLIGVSVAIFVLVGGSLVVRGGTSLGTLLALVFYNSHFLSRSMLLIERLFDFRLLGVRLERLEDIVFSEPERAGPSVDQGVSPTGRGSSVWRGTGKIEMRHVSFRYGELEPLILHDVNLEISAGEFVALVGDNGAGKTTLLKLLLGLYRPASGQILFDELDINDISLSLLRSQIGVVTQDEQLFNGTLAQNVALFDPAVDLDRIAWATEMACIREDIERLPLGYNTRMGQLGSVFSEGQKQKLFLARALYRQPRILIMDEGTANLDLRSEDRVLQNIRSLSVTKLMIAHHSPTILSADRVLLLREGRVTHVSDSAKKTMLRVRIPSAITA